MIRTVIFACLVVFVVGLGSCPLQRPTQCTGFRNSTLVRREFPHDAGLQCSLFPPVQCPILKGNATVGEFLLLSEPTMERTSLLPLALQCPAPASHDGFDFGPQLYAFYLNASIVSNRK
ncbi:uncharacterized protein LOC119587586 [Penaeus monodon]|uniref:uncharacterized protein LOC119587586 n=1 Tax=Penaeus monodon TaxID=6687 RepID=UPI0018A78926|nr:uncharacterized protein LOC119587586 [Penaeus monodon]